MITQIRRASRLLTAMAVVSLLLGVATPAMAAGTPPPRAVHPQLGSCGWWEFWCVEETPPPPSPPPASPPAVPVPPAPPPAATAKASPPAPTSTAAPTLVLRPRPGAQRPMVGRMTTAQLVGLRWAMKKYGWSAVPGEAGPISLAQVETEIRLRPTPTPRETPPPEGKNFQFAVPARYGKPQDFCPTVYRALWRGGIEGDGGDPGAVTFWREVWHEYMPDFSGEGLNWSLDKALAFLRAYCQDQFDVVEEPDLDALEDGVTGGAVTVRRKWVDRDYTHFCPDGVLLRAAQRILWIGTGLVIVGTAAMSGQPEFALVGVYVLSH